MLKKVLIGAIVVLGVLFLAGTLISPPVWISPEIRARVADEAGKPVQGAVVVLNWQLYGGVHGTPDGSLATLEAVTNANGEFVIAKWGPIWTRRKGLRDHEPRTYIFHPNFVPLVINNEIAADQKLAKHWVVIEYRMNGRSFVLQAPKSSPESYEADLRDFSNTLSQVLDGADPCAWTYMPQMISAIYKVRQELQKKQAGYGLLDISRLESVQKEKVCGDPKELLKGYLE